MRRHSHELRELIKERRPRHPDRAAQPLRLPVMVRPVVDFLYRPAYLRVPERVDKRNVLLRFVYVRPDNLDENNLGQPVDYRIRPGLLRRRLVGDEPHGAVEPGRIVAFVAGDLHERRQVVDQRMEPVALELKLAADEAAPEAAPSVHERADPCIPRLGQHLAERAGRRVALVRYAVRGPVGDDNYVAVGHRDSVAPPFDAYKTVPPDHYVKPGDVGCRRDEDAPGRSQLRPEIEAPLYSQLVKNVG